MTIDKTALAKSIRLTSRQKANAIRALSMDAVEQANSGHPGAPMGMADMAEVLWNRFLKFNPKNPNWFNRDRFVLSNGHGSMLLYSLLHLSGYDLSISDLENFRKLHSKTPGHPEQYMTPGVETTTGPLGQGLANAVGFAIAEKLLAAKYNRENFNIVDHFTYVFVGDGCLMEGVSHEVASLAGTLGLGKLIVLWDDNNISIDGVVTPWFNDNTPERFKAYNWQVISNIDGHDSQAIEQAINQAKNNLNQPSLICCKTIIGYGAPNKQGTESTHGSPLGAAEIKSAREFLNWPYEPFNIPEEYYQAWDGVKKGRIAEEIWNNLIQEYKLKYPDLAKEYLARMNNMLPEDFESFAVDYIYSLQSEQNKQDHSNQKNLATRQSSQNVLSAFGPKLAELFGGSADLTGSNGTLWKGAKAINKQHWDGQYLHYGVREFGMAAICNGMALYNGFIPYSGTFLTFLDYGRNAVRMAALMKLRNIFVFTHDSIALGEDGPTHQPIEHLTMLRATPNLDCWRPCDAVEAAVAWQQAIKNQSTPSALILTRQAVQSQQRNLDDLDNISKGGYILADFDESQNQADANYKKLIIIATGSEVELAIAIKAKLNNLDHNLNIRVVSMPCVERFKAQSIEYKNLVLSNNTSAINTLVIEAGARMSWYEFVKNQDYIIGIDTYGESASASDLLPHFGFTVEKIINKIKNLNLI
jgi:transketolase